MPKSIYSPFTYLIGWSWLNVWYYGARWKQGCHPDDLWTKYFTSSDFVAIQRWLYGEPDIIEVRKTFQTEKETRNWEHKVLKRMKVRKSDRWLNKTDRKGPSNFGIPHSEEHKQKMRKPKSSTVNMKKPKSETHKQNMSKARLRHSFI